MAIASPRYADPFDSDPELLAHLRDLVQDIDHSQGAARVVHLNRLEWFVREQIGKGIAEGTRELQAQVNLLEQANANNLQWALAGAKIVENLDASSQEASQ